MHYNLTGGTGGTSLSVVGENLNEVIPDTHPNFVTIRDYLLNNTEHDEQHVSRLVNPALSISESLAEITDRITYEHNNLFFDGLPIHSILGRHILRMIEEGDNDYARFVKFLINLDANPSFRCQQAVYKWVSDNGLTITPDGNFLGYKGVRSDGKSVTAGPNNFIDGKLLGTPGVSYHVPNEVGTVVSKKRAEVDDNPALACSVGLHVGTQSYATGWGARLITVEINPADVVSVPDRDLSYKIRVCRYKVVALADPKQFAHASWNPSETDVPDEETTEPEAAPVDQTEEAEDVSEQEETTEEENAPTDPSASLTLTMNAALLPDLMTDLYDPTLGHKPLARKWSHLTTEASVRRFRKANGINLTLTTKVKDSLTS